MGNCQSCRVGGGAWRPAARREITLLLLGLDGAGKSTILANLMEEDAEDVLPTIGFANATTTLANCHLKLFDVGGGPRIRGIWKNYYAQSHGIIFVVDAGSPDRLNEARQVLSGVLQEETVAGKPLVILANKQDQPGALGTEEVRERLGLDSLLNENQQQCIRVVGCVGLCNSDGGRRGRRQIVRGVGRVVREVRGRWGDLGERVGRDTDRQRERQEREREERKERVRRIREERERQAALQKGLSSNGVEGNEENTAVNPFKPISEVVAEATEREARAKELKKKKSKEAAKGDQEMKVPEEADGEGKAEEQKERNDQQTTSALAEDQSVAQTGQHEPSNAVLSRRRKGETKAAGDTVNHHSPVLSSGSEGEVSSGLSTSSSDSLTHVTVASKEEETSLTSESLGPPLTTPPAQSVAMATTRQTTEGVEANERRDGRRDEEKGTARGIRSKMSRFNFLSRLKNRNRIAPSTQPITATTSDAPVSSLIPPPLTTTSGRGRSTSQGLTYPVTAQTHPTVANGAWEREKDGEREKEGHTESIAMESAVPEDREDVFDNMPELPKTRHTLPPVQVHRRLPGLEEQTFTTSQDMICSH